MEEMSLTNSSSKCNSEEIPLNLENLFMIKCSDNQSYKLKIKLKH